MDLSKIYSMQDDLIQRLVSINDKGEMIATVNGLEFSSVFQPIVDCSKRIVALEGLIRIKDSVGNNVNPYEYFKNINDNDLESVISTLICGKIHTHNFAMSHFSNKLLFINVSPVTFAILSNNEQAILNFLDKITSLKLNPNQIIYEITEFKERDIENIVNGKNILEKFNILTALDDYGADYSNEYRALKIRPPYLKIDKSIIDMCDSGCDSDLKEAIKVAQDISAITIAEGIETENAFNKCRDNNIDFFQGYFFDKPLSASELKSKVNITTAHDLKRM
ncbi:EAL domain-containing protein [Moritella sp. 24]|uniref:EAL domain-containing protein n=1 Tax=Moritella sp. 24 TaxID=2746230 RepID=UPI001BACFA5A|nr:EAL domain-containing protein [Moritella sp. 24]QUM76234.1 EAL domain-containing protein [Moritella sp. 24]